MRILGEIPHPTWKITIFQMENKLSVKIECGMLEQTYKLRDNQLINSKEEVAEWLDDAFLRQISLNFQQMHKAAGESYARLKESIEDSDFDPIL